MASSINKASIMSYGSPDIKYYVTYTASRSSNSSVKYTFTIKTYLVGNDEAWLGKGHDLVAYVTVNGVQNTVTLKTSSEKWSGGSSSGNLKSTQSVSVTCPSTSGGTKQTVTFQVVNSYGSAGDVKTADYYVTSPALLSTDCTAPTTFTASSNNFETDVTLTWSGAKSGTNNSIESYLIRYRTSSNNSTWGSWTDLTTVSSTSTSGNKTIDMSSKVSRGYYVQFAIRTQGKAGSSYYSSWAYSSSIRRKPYTKCTSPTSFTVTPDMDSTSQFDIQATLTWSGATSGSNNSINGYLIRYRTSSNNSTWGSWTDLTTIATTKTSGSITVDLSSLITRKHYVQFAIRTQGKAGSSYYSSWIFANTKDSSDKATSFQRNPYSACIAPTTVTLTSEKDLDGNTHSDIFETRVTIQWDGASAGANNNIVGYYVQVKLKDDATGKWEDTCYDLDGNANQQTQINTILSNGTYTAYLDWISRGKTATILMATLGSAGSSYYSAYKGYDVEIKRNSIPNAVSLISVPNLPSLEFSNGNDIVLNWEKPNDIDDNIHHYRIQVSIGSKNDVIDYYGTTMLSNSAKVVWTDLIGDLSENANAMTFTDPLTSNSYIVLNGSATTHTLKSTNAYYIQIDNSNTNATDSLVQFRIVAIDIFGVYADVGYVYSPIITRYDMTGVAIGINGKWVNCQLFVGTNGSWVEQDVSAGINGVWVDTDDGV